MSWQTAPMATSVTTPSRTVIARLIPPDSSISISAKARAVERRHRAHLPSGPYTRKETPTDR